MIGGRSIAPTAPPEDIVASAAVSGTCASIAITPNANKTANGFVNSEQGISIGIAYAFA